MHIQLHHLIAFSAAGIGDIHGDRDITSRLLCFGRDDEVAVAESRIAEAIAKGIERTEDAGVVLWLRPRPPITWRPVGRPIARLRARFIGKVPLDLTGRLWESDREFAARVVVAKKGLGYGLAAELVGEPGFENGGDIGVGPIDGKGVTVVGER